MNAAMFFHDRFALAWVIVAAYFVGAIAAFVASRGGRKRDRRFWLAICVLLVVLGLNKELDLQTYVTVEGRELAKSFGWYEQRRLVQGVFLLALALAAVITVGALMKGLRRSPPPMKWAAVGIALLLIFILARAATFHHIDEWVTINFGGLRSGWWIELAGIAVIAVSAIAFRSRSGRKLSR